MLRPKPLRLRNHNCPSLPWILLSPPTEGRNEIKTKELEALTPYPRRSSQRCAKARPSFRAGLFSRIELSMADRSKSAAIAVKPNLGLPETTAAIWVICNNKILVFGEQANPTDTIAETINIALGKMGN